MTKLYVTTYERPGEVGGEVLIHTSTQPEKAIGFIRMGYPGGVSKSVELLSQAGTPVRAIFDAPAGGRLKFHIIDLETLPSG